MDQDEIAYVLSVEDFDKSLLPLGARIPGTDEFRQAVSDFYAREYVNFGGFVRIVVNDKVISVSWRPDPNKPEPLDVAVDALKTGDYQRGVLLLELIRQQRPTDVGVLYNLGMALSDMGQLNVALEHLRRLITIEPNHVNALVAVGVALARQRKYAEAVEVLNSAVAIDPDNPWAQRNLGACLLQNDQLDLGVDALRRAVKLNPRDQQALFGLAEALLKTGADKKADEYYVRTIKADSRSQIAEMAKEARSKLAQQSFRDRSPSGVRMDAVMYILGALQKFDKMSREEVQKVAFEIALLGQRGLDTNDSSQKYQLRSLPGRFSGLHLLCYMYAGFQEIAPDHSVGFDLSKEYEAARGMLKSDQGK